MGMMELILTALSLAMDAFAVSVCKGLSAGRVTVRHALTAGLWFGGFQALMPLLGWLLGVRFQSFIAGVDHWIAFVLLGIIGVNMVRESFRKDDEPVEASFGFRAMLLPAVALIGGITFGLSALGVRAGGIVGLRGKSRAELLGGAVLVLLGLKILLEHLGVLG